MRQAHRHAAKSLGAQSVCFVGRVGATTPRFAREYGKAREVVRCWCEIPQAPLDLFAASTPEG